MRAPVGETYASASLDPNFVYYQTVAPNRIGRQGARWVDPSETQQAPSPATRSSAAVAPRRSCGACGAAPEPDAEPLPTSTMQPSWARALQSFLLAGLPHSQPGRKRWLCVSRRRRGAAADALTLGPYAALGNVDGRDARVQELLLATPGVQELLQRAAHLVFAIQSSFGQRTVRVPGRRGRPLRHSSLCGFRAALACASASSALILALQDLLGSHMHIIVEHLALGAPANVDP